MDHAYLHERNGEPVLTTGSAEPPFGHAAQAVRPQMVAASKDQILVTGANGFIGSWVVRTLLASGFTKIRCLARAASGSANLDRIRAEFGASSLEVVRRNLLSREACARAAEGVPVVDHHA